MRHRGYDTPLEAAPNRNPLVEGPVIRRILRIFPEETPLVSSLERPLARVRRPRSNYPFEVSSIIARPILSRDPFEGHPLNLASNPTTVDSPPIDRALAGLSILQLSSRRKAQG